jgi:histidinol-phosphate aminotransferase
MTRLKGFIAAAELDAAKVDANAFQQAKEALDRTSVRVHEVAIARSLLSNPRLLVMDEAYLEFLEDPADLASLVRLGVRPNLLLMRTFSKIYGLAGLRIGYGIGHPDLISALEKIRQPFNINSLAQAGALAALDDQEYVRRTRANNLAGLQFFQRAFRALKLEYVPSAANFILVRVGRGQAVFAAMQKQGVIARPMDGYQLGEWLRISVGTPGENERCLSALKSALDPK